MCIFIHVHVCMCVCVCVSVCTRIRAYACVGVQFPSSSSSSYGLCRPTHPLPPSSDACVYVYTLIYVISYGLGNLNISIAPCNTGQDKHQLFQHVSRSKNESPLTLCDKPLFQNYQKKLEFREMMHALTVVSCDDNSCIICFVLQLLDTKTTITIKIRENFHS